MPTPSIAIVGGGFSGTLAAVHLSRRLPNIPIILFEESPEAGPGLAYGTRSSDHLLNIRAGAMSAFGDAPDDFRKFASRELRRDVASDEFLPRSLYGDYLRHLLRLAQITSPALEVRYARVQDIVSGEDGRARMLLKNGDTYEASRVVLATGNQDSAFSGSVWASHTRSTRDHTAFENLPKDATVVIIGSGLSMIDAVADLERLGHTGPIHVTSRHGLLPHAYQAPSGVEPPALEHLPDSDLRKSLRLFRKAVEAHETAGGNWRDLFASLRPVTPGLWQELSPRDRKRFLRFLSPFWEIHRHQCAPQTRAIVDGLIASGRLTLHRGTLVSVERKGERWSIELAARAKGQTTRTWVADRILDATGPARDLQTIRQPLVCNLLRRGFLVPDAHRLGAETLADYRALQRNGLPSPWLHVLGPMLRSRYFEATAVGELRLHAAALAARIAGEFAEGHDEKPRESKKTKGVAA